VRVCERVSCGFFSGCGRVPLQKPHTSTAKQWTLDLFNILLNRKIQNYLKLILKNIRFKINHFFKSIVFSIFTGVFIFISSLYRVTTACPTSPPSPATPATNRQWSKGDKNKCIAVWREQHHRTYFVSHLASSKLIKWISHSHSRAAAKGNNNKWWRSGSNCRPKRTSSIKNKKRSRKHAHRQDEKKTATHTHTHTHIYIHMQTSLARGRQVEEVEEAAGRRRIGDVWNNKQQEHNTTTQQQQRRQQQQQQQPTNAITVKGAPQKMGKWAGIFSFLHLLFCCPHCRISIHYFRFGWVCVYGRVFVCVRVQQVPLTSSGIISPRKRGFSVQGSV